MIITKQEIQDIFDCRAVKLSIKIDDISDGSHTFSELYEFRMLYNALLFNEWAKQNKYDVHKSKKHHDGQECFDGNWFVVVAELPNGQITNHYEMKHWNLFRVTEKEVANEWDGHSAQDVLMRMKEFLDNHE